MRRARGIGSRSATDHPDFPFAKLRTRIRKLGTVRRTPTLFFHFAIAAVTQASALEKMWPQEKREQGSRSPKSPDLAGEFGGTATGGGFRSPTRP